LVVIQINCTAQDDNVQDMTTDSSSGHH